MKILIFALVFGLAGCSDYSYEFSNIDYLLKKQQREIDELKGAVKRLEGK